MLVRRSQVLSVLAKGSWYCYEDFFFQTSLIVRGSIVA